MSNSFGFVFCLSKPICKLHLPGLYVSLQAKGGFSYICIHGLRRHTYVYLLTGNYSCLVAKFHLSRSIGFHMVQSYIPTILIVVISWVSFWMDVDSVPGRTTLGVTTLLTVSSKSAGMKATKSNHQQRPQEALLLHKKASIANIKKTF